MGGAWYGFCMMRAALGIACCAPTAGPHWVMWVLCSLELQAHAGQGSNLRPAVLETDALPAELPAHTPGRAQLQTRARTGPGHEKSPA